MSNSSPYGAIVACEIRCSVRDTNKYSSCKTHLSNRRRSRNSSPRFAVVFGVGEAVCLRGRSADVADIFNGPSNAAVREGVSGGRVRCQSGGFSASRSSCDGAAVGDARVGQCDGFAVIANDIGSRRGPDAANVLGDGLVSAARDNHVFHLLTSGAEGVPSGKSRVGRPEVVSPSNAVG